MKRKFSFEEDVPVASTPTPPPQVPITNIRIKYNGEFPNLCSGKLIVFINNKMWEFPDYCLESGGECYVNYRGDDIINQGDWTINAWPVGFPEEYMDLVESSFNRLVPLGCCGGCR